MQMAGKGASERYDWLCKQGVLDNSGIASAERVG